MSARLALFSKGQVSSDEKLPFFEKVAKTKKKQPQNPIF